MTARSLADELLEHARETVEKEGVALLDVEVAPRPRTLLRFVIDGEGGATIRDCVRVDRALAGFLATWERAPESYVIEVTSPGLDRRLRRDEEYDHFRGRLVRLHAEIEDEGAREWVGVLGGRDGGDVILCVEDEIVRIPKERIRSARLLFKKEQGKSGSGRKK
jgi:ribosome maturation factor RimP